MKRWLVTAITTMMIAALGLVQLTGCGSGGGGGNNSGVVSVAAITDSDGTKLPDIIDLTTQNPSGLTDITGLSSGQRVEVMLFKDGAPQYPQPLMFTADEAGVVPLTLFYDLGIDPTTGMLDPSAAGSYVIEMSSNGQTIATRSFILANGVSAQSRSRSNAQGNLSVMTDRGGQNVFALGSIENGKPVIIWGRGFQSGDRYAIYIVRDRNDWAVGSSYSDSSGQVEIATVEEGQFQVTVWNQAITTGDDRDFDVIAKKLSPGATAPTNPSLTQDDIVEGKVMTAFTVQTTGIGIGDRIIPMATDRNGNRKNQLGAGDNLYCSVNPPWRPQVYYGYVTRYVTLHEREWTNHKNLVDATGRPTYGAVRSGCTNMGNVCVWPNIPAGRYNIVIDVNNNGEYDKGVDLLDNDILVIGNTQGVEVRPNIAVGSNQSLVSRGQEATVYVKILWTDGVPASSQTVSFTLRSGSGTLSAATAVTDENGEASIRVTPTARGAELVIVASASVRGQNGTTYPLSGECYIATKAAGDMTVNIQ